MNFNNIKAGIRAFGAVVSKHSPEILMGLGTVSFVTTVIVASKETVKAQDILSDHEDELLYIESCYDMKELDEDAYKKSRRDVYFHTSGQMIKNYLPAVSIGAVSIASFFGAYGIMRKRYATLVVAYTALEESFRKYRERVVESRGADEDIYYLTGVKPKEITTKDEDGNKVKTKQITMPDGSIASPYAFKFSKYKENGERNEQWKSDNILNWSYVTGQEEWLEDQLYLRCVFDKDHKVKIRGAVFLNEVRQLLGESMTDSGAVVGWLASNGEPGRNGRINLHAMEATEKIYDPEVDAEVELPCILINPNVDGLIYDLVGKKEKKPFELSYDIYGEDITI